MLIKVMLMKVMLMKTLYLYSYELCLYLSFHVVFIVIII